MIDKICHPYKKIRKICFIILDGKLKNYRHKYWHIPQNQSVHNYCNKYSGKEYSNREAAE
jgi:hypothetical protein